MNLNDVQHAIIDQRWFNYVRVGHDERPLEFLEGGMLGRGAARCERTWALEAEGGVVHLVISGHTFITCRLVCVGGNDWEGRWLEYERMPIRLEPLSVIDRPSELTLEEGEPAHFVKVQGLERSGTNYLAWLVRRNFAKAKVLVNATGWKHARIPAMIDWSGEGWEDPALDSASRHRRIADDLEELRPHLDRLKSEIRAHRLRYVVVCKNPVSWYASYARYKRVSPSPVRRRWLNRWSALNGHWVEFVDRRPEQCRVFRYEDLLIRGEELLSRELSAFGIERRPGPWREPIRQLKPGGSLGDAFEPDYYRNRSYLSHFTPRDLRRISKHVPESLVSRLGYTLPPAMTH